MFLPVIREILVYFWDMLTVKVFEFNPVQENTYVLYNEEKSAIVVDPGCYFENERRQLKDFITENQLTPTNLVNTHCHLDHVFGNRFVAETWKKPLQIHERERLVLDYAPISGEQYNLPFENYEGEIIYLKEGDVIKLGQDELQVIFAPGHAPGHICLYHAKQQFLIAGDVLFRMSIGRTDIPGGNHNTLIRSIREKLFVLPDEVVVYPGHGPSTTIGFEKANNPFLAG